MKMTKKISLALMASAMLFTSCELFTEYITEYQYYNKVTANEHRIWEYSQRNPIFEITPEVLSVTVNNMPSGKSMYLVKHNVGNQNIKLADTRTITNIGRSAISSESDVISVENIPIETDTVPFRTHFVGEPVPEIKNISRAGLNAAVKETPSFIDYTEGATKKIYIDANEAMDRYELVNATLRATNSVCNVWVVDSYYTTGNPSGNRVNKEIAKNYARKFAEMYPVITNVFGDESDLIIDYDADAYGKIENYSDTGKKVNIVIYDLGRDYVDSETISKKGVLGYFYSKDYYSSKSSQYSSSIVSKSNVGKYFYIDSAYAVSNFNGTISTLAHEFQHMVNFNKKNIAHGLQPTTAYNEMLSMLCEDMMQELLELEDYDSPKNRIYGFNAYYYASGITEYRNDSYASLSYSTSYAFGSWLARQYGGSKFVKALMDNEFVDNQSIVAAVNSVNSKNYTFETLFKQFLLALTKNTTYTHNKDAAEDIEYSEDFYGYKYPMKKIDLWWSGSQKYKQNGKENVYQFTLKDTEIQKSYRQYAYSAYDWNGPFLFNLAYGYELRSGNGISIHGVETTTSGSKTYTFTPSGADTLKMYLIIQ